MVHRLSSVTASGPSGPGAVLSYGPPRVSRVAAAVRAAGFVVAAVLVAVLGLGLVVGPHLAGYRVLYVRTASMEPTLPVGSLVVVQRVDAADVEAGDILTFSHPDRPGNLITHRVVQREAAGFVTQGDANASPDPWRVPAVGSGWRHSFAVPGVGYVLGYLRSGVVSTGALVAAIVLGAGQVLRMIWRPAPVVAIS